MQAFNPTSFKDSFPKQQPGPEPETKKLNLLSASFKKSQIVLGLITVLTFIAAPILLQVALSKISKLSNVIIANTATKMDYLRSLIFGTVTLILFSIFFATRYRPDQMIAKYKIKQAIKKKAQKFPVRRFLPKIELNIKKPKRTLGVLLEDILLQSTVLVRFKTLGVFLIVLTAAAMVLITLYMKGIIDPQKYRTPIKILRHAKWAILALIGVIIGRLILFFTLCRFMPDKRAALRKRQMERANADLQAVHDHIEGLNRVSNNKVVGTREALDAALYKIASEERNIYSQTIPKNSTLTKEIEMVRETELMLRLLKGPGSVLGISMQTNPIEFRIRLMQLFGFAFKIIVPSSTSISGDQEETWFHRLEIKVDDDAKIFFDVYPIKIEKSIIEKDIWAFSIRRTYVSKEKTSGDNKIDALVKCDSENFTVNFEDLKNIKIFNKDQRFALTGFSPELAQIYFHMDSDSEGDHLFGHVNLKIKQSETSAIIFEGVDVFYTPETLDDMIQYLPEHIESRKAISVLAHVDLSIQAKTLLGNFDIGGNIREEKEIHNKFTEFVHSKTINGKSATFWDREIS